MSKSTCFLTLATVLLFTRTSDALAFETPPPHQPFQAHLETDPDRKVYFCYKTIPGWEYVLEEAGDPAGAWTPHAAAIYGGGQAMRMHLFTLPEANAPQPPPPNLDTRTHYMFTITHFQDHPGCMVCWRMDNAAVRCYLPNVEFREPGTLRVLDSVQVEDATHRLWLIAYCMPVWNPDNGSLGRASLTAA